MIQVMSASQLVILEHESAVLKSNPLGDPNRRKIYVYLPENLENLRKVPAILSLVGFTGTGAMLFNSDPFVEDLKTRMDRLIASGKCPPVIMVAPDCFNKFGGSQYLNSSAIGRYEDYLIHEIVPALEKRYSISRWGVFGKSSGGYGSLILGMKHPQLFQVLGCHSGDCNFELCYLPDFPKALNAFKRAGGPKAWLDNFWQDVNHKRGEYHAALNTFAMAAHYSPDPDSPHLGVEFPFCLETGVFKQAVWDRWRAHDPVNLVEKYAENLKKLRYIFVDCGTRDEFGLHWGARALVKKLRNNGVSVDHQEFEDGHMSIQYRYDVSIPLLARALGES